MKNPKAAAFHPLLSGLFFLFFFLAGFAPLSGQQFSGSGGLIPDNNQFVSFELPVSGLPAAAQYPDFGLDQVCIEVQHTYNDDLEIYLLAPDGTLIDLVSRVGGDSDNFTGTCFRQDADSSILLGTGPFSSVFRPEGILGNVNNGQNPNGVWKILARDVAPPDEGSLLSWTLSFSQSPASPFVFNGSNLPLVKINTENQLISSGPKIMARMEIVDHGQGQQNQLDDVANAYSGWIGIEKRGHSSASFSQAQYNVETRDSLGNNLNVPLLGMPAENDWVLYGPFNDKSLMRNVLTYEFGKRMGRYASRWRFCEVFLNGNYQGVYTFFETIKRDPGRVNISNLKPSDLSGAELTGGYICSIDWADDGGWYSQFPPDQTHPVNNQVFFQYVEPADSEIMPQQSNYIASFVDSFERALYSPQFTDPALGWRRYAGEGSFVDFFLMNELSKNVDGYRLSTFFYKEKITDGNKIHMGPLWDFNLAWHNADYCSNELPGGWAYTFTNFCEWDMPNWWRRLMQDPGFRTSLKCRWKELRSSAFSNAAFLGFIDSTAAHLAQAQLRHFSLYPVWGVYLWPNPSPLSLSFEEEISRLKTWVTQRLYFLDNNLPGICPVTGSLSLSGADDGISVIYLPEMRQVMLDPGNYHQRGKGLELSLFNVRGQTLFRSSSVLEKTAFSVPGPPEGLHFYSLTDKEGKLLKTGKISFGSR